MQWVWGTLLGKFLGTITLVHVWGLKEGKDGSGKLGGNFSNIIALASQPHVLGGQLWGFLFSPQSTWKLEWIAQQPVVLHLAHHKGSVSWDRMRHLPVLNSLDTTSYPCLTAYLHLKEHLANSPDPLSASYYFLLKSASLLFPTHFITGIPVLTGKEGKYFIWGKHFSHPYLFLHIYISINTHTHIPIQNTVASLNHWDICPGSSPVGKCFSFHYSPALSLSSFMLPRAWNDLHLQFQNLWFLLNNQWHSMPSKIKNKRQAGHPRSRLGKWGWYDLQKSLDLNMLYGRKRVTCLSPFFQLHPFPGWGRWTLSCILSLLYLLNERDKRKYLPF